MEKELDLKVLFPNLIIFLGMGKKDSLLKKLQKSFNESHYPNLFKTEGKCFNSELGREISTCRIMQCSDVPVCLAEGEGILPCDAEQDAAEKLLNKLCDSFYVIKTNPEYFSKSHVPSMVLNADPSQSHVYKVVFLKKNSRGVPFPKPVSGAIDYVEDYNELFQYIEMQVKSDTKPDIFILNVLKCDRANIRQLCQRNSYTVSFLVGCSDMGIHAYFSKSILMIQQSLLKDGGENVKYKFIGPRDKYGDNEDKFDKGRDSKVASVQYQHSTLDGGEIVVDRWISEHLVLMDYFTESNELEFVREIIYQSVRDCPDTEEFIIEKTRSDSGMIYADAMIDRKVVGRARGFNEGKVKTEAAENAMHNLSKYCPYIKAKRSYFGSSQELPNFLQDRDVTKITKFYRIERKSNNPPIKILQEFKHSFQEELYFPDYFSQAERDNIAMLAKGLHFKVRWVGRRRFLCVYKRRKPKELLMELLSTQSKENEMYKLIMPTEKCEVAAPPATKNRTNQESGGSEIKQEVSCQRLSVDPEFRGSCSSSVSQPQVYSQYHKNQHDVHEGVSTRGQDDVYSRYHTSNFNNRGTYQRHDPYFDEGPQSSGQRPRQSFDQGADEHFNPNFNQGADKRPNQNLIQRTDEKSNQNFKQEPNQGQNKTLCEDEDKDLSLSERLHRKLAALNQRNNQDSMNPTNEPTCSNSNKRPSSDFITGTVTPQFSNVYGNTGMNQRYDEMPNNSSEGPKKFSNLFDLDGSSDSQAPARTPNANATWVKNKKFRGHSFSKLAKYGQQRGSRGGF